MPMKGPDRDEFLKAIYHLNELKTFQKANIHIHDGDVAEVNSKKHLPLQVMDGVLGSMCFRLNDKHKERGIDGKRAKRNIVKDYYFSTKHNSNCFIRISLICSLKDNGCITSRFSP